MDRVVQQLVEFVSSIPADHIVVVYLVAAAWVAIESFGIGLPIEPVLLALGAIASQGKLNPALGLVGAIAAALLGTLTGAGLGYAIGRRAGHGVVRAGRIVGLDQARIEHMKLWLRQRGVMGIIFARFVPVLRGLAPYALGATDVPLPLFLVGTAIGGLGYTSVWIVAGFALGNKYAVAMGFFDRFGILGFVLIVAIVAALYVMHDLGSRYVWQRMPVHSHRHIEDRSSTP